MLISHPIVLLQLPNLLMSPLHKPHSMITNHTLRLLACKGIRSLNDNQELSPGVTKLLESSLSPATIKAYRRSFAFFNSWCNRRDYDPINLPTNLILEYLKDVFEEKSSHAAVNTARSALSFYLQRRDGMSVGELPEIARLCKGASRQHPSQPRYHSTWDVDQMLSYIKTLDKNEDLSLPILTKKLTMLLALATGGRASDLLSYHSHLVQWTSPGVTLARNCRGKSSESGKRVFFPVCETEQLCIPIDVLGYI